MESELVSISLFEEIWYIEQVFLCYLLQGYVILEQFFTRDELDPCKAAIEVLVEGLAQKLYTAGKIKGETPIDQFHL